MKLLQLIQKFSGVTRSYALPMTVLSWFVAFAYALKPNGNFIFGLIALIGVCLVHLGANVFDDVVDYCNLPKTKDEYGNIKLETIAKNKCDYILDGTMTVIQAGQLAMLLFFLAFVIGVFFTFKVGMLTILFMGLAGVLGLVYPLLGKVRLCEVAIALLYGPLLFGGVYYVMHGVYDWKTLIVCIPTMLFTVNLLYTDTMSDFECDVMQHKKTLSNWFKDKLKALIFQRVMLIFAYLSVYLMYSMKIVGLKVFTLYVTIPLAMSLLDSIYMSIKNKNYVPKRKIYEFPMEHYEKFLKEGVMPFMFRMYQARNLMIFCSLILGIVLLVR